MDVRRGYPGDVERFRRTVRGDKEWEANVKAAVGFPLLIPPDRALGRPTSPRRGNSSSARGAVRGGVAVREFAGGAEPLPGNCCLVARQRLSPSGESRQPLNIRVPGY